jgi:hypothetical protein
VRNLGRCRSAVPPDGVLNVIPTSASGPVMEPLIRDPRLRKLVLDWLPMASVTRQVRAARHARTTARDHVRPDGSTFHVVGYDQATGSVTSRGTA